MSYSIMPFSVAIERVRSAVGSRDRGLADALKTKYASWLQQDVDDNVADDDADDDYDPEPSLEQALDDMIDGKELQEGFGHKYGSVLEMLCDHFGTLLPNDAFSGMSAEWADEVDEALQTAGVPSNALKLTTHLMYRSSPVPIPEPADFPLYRVPPTRRDSVRLGRG